MRCEVLDTCTIVVGKGSIVEVSDRQYELARKFLKPLVTKEKKATNEEKTEESVEVEVPQKETRKKKK